MDSRESPNHSLGMGGCYKMTFVSHTTTDSHEHVHVPGGAAHHQYVGAAVVPPTTRGGTTAIAES